MIQHSGDRLLVKSDVAFKQQEANKAAVALAASGGGATVVDPPGGLRDAGFGRFDTPAGYDTAKPKPQPTRYYGTYVLDATRVGRDAARAADEVIAHLSGLIGATVTVTLEITAAVPNGIPDKIIRTVTENSRTLKFTAHGFENE